MSSYRIFLIAVLSIILSQSTVDLYIPSLLAMQHALHTSSKWVQLTLTFYLIGYALAQLFYGYLADRWGRRPALLLGYGIFCLATLGAALTNNIYWLLGWRLLQGAGIAAAPVMVRTILRDLFQGTELVKAASVLLMLWSVIPIVAPLLGGYIQTYLGWQANFRLLLLIGLIFMVITWRYLPETKKVASDSGEKPDSILKIVNLLSRNKYFLLGNFGSLCSSGLLLAYTTNSAFILQAHFNLSPVLFGWITFSIAMANLCGSTVNRQFVSRYSHAAMLRNSSRVILAGVLVLLITSYLPYHSMWFIIIPIAVIVFGEGWIYANFSTTAYNAVQHNIGMSSAIFGTINIAGCAIITAIVAHLSTQSVIPLAWILLLLCLTIMILSAKISREKSEL